MERLYASVNHGMEELAADILRSMGFAGVETRPSALLYSGDSAVRPPCVNNIYRVLACFCAPGPQQALSYVAGQSYAYGALPGRTFRVVVMDCGRLKAVSPDIMRRAEAAIARQSGLKPNRASPDVEIWLNRHNTGEVYYMVRLQKHAPFEKALQKGELRPDIAQAVVYLAGIKRAQEVLEPMAGWGGIAAAALERGAKVVAGDSDAACVAFMRRRFEGNKSIRVYGWDALRLPWEEGRFTHIVTDPPWGDFAAIKEGLYAALIPELLRVLKPAGHLTLLTARVEETLLLLQAAGLQPSRSMLRVNGKEAGIITAEKKRGN